MRSKKCGANRRSSLERASASIYRERATKKPGTREERTTMRTLLRGATMYREKRGSGMKQKKFYGIRVGLVVSEASVAVLRPER